MSRPKLLESRVVLVTGGSSGIGAAVARASVEAGAAVVLAARGVERGEETAAELRGAGGTAEFVQADMADAADIERLVGHTVERHGRIDCAFNNAASADGSLRPAADFSEDEFDRVIAVNLKGVWLSMKYQIAQMRSQDPPAGSIVNTSSVNGLGGAPGGALYSASKAGVLALTKSAAQDYAKYGIRINALAAGAFATPMLDGVIDRVGGGTEEGREAVRMQYTSMIPQRRIGEPAEAASAVVWLLSDEASYVTGHSMIVDGGLTAMFR